MCYTGYVCLRACACMVLMLCVCVFICVFMRTCARVRASMCAYAGDYVSVLMRLCNMVPCVYVHVDMYAFVIVYSSVNVCAC